MANLWFFNPWNDLALATDSPFYTPPTAALELQRSGESMPMWIANQNDYVLMGAEAKESYEIFSLTHNVAKPWEGQQIENCIPWGWSKATRQIFRNIGITDEFLPTDKKLDIWRNLSHRKTTILFHNQLSNTRKPYEAHSPEECKEVLKKWGKVIGKYPWSSSGRGLFQGVKEYQDSFLRRCIGCINHQGSVILEYQYDVAVDFAMLFYIDSFNKVNYIGLSLFENNKRAYVGNYLLSQNEILSFLSKYIDPQLIIETKNNLIKLIEKEIAAFYTGPIGIDMFIYMKDCYYFLNPCVEINLRYTMGFLAHALSTRHFSNIKSFFKIIREEKINKDDMILNNNKSLFHFLITPFYH